MFTRQPQFGIALFIAGALSTAAYAGSVTPVMLEAYTGTVAGTNECQGGGPPAALSFFDTGVGFGLGLVNGNNTGIASCGLAGSISDITSVTGPANSTSTLNNAGFVGASPTTTYTGAASATANYGTIGASASGTLNGPVPAAGVSESVAFAIVSDTLDILGSGNGYVIFDYTMSGSLTVNSPYLGGGTQEVDMQLGTNADQRVFYGQASQVGAVVDDVNGQPISGCTVLTESFSCTNATFSTAMSPITFGTATAYDFGLVVSAWPENSTTVDPDITLTGIQVFDSNENSIGNFTIISGSGTTYGADGVESSTPEPATFLMAACALIAAGLARRANRPAQ